MVSLSEFYSLESSKAAILITSRLEDTFSLVVMAGRAEFIWPVSSTHFRIGLGKAFIGPPKLGVRVSDEGVVVNASDDWQASTDA